MIKLIKRTIPKNGKTWSDHRWEISDHTPKNSFEETIGMISDAKSQKFIAIQRPRNPTKSIRFPRLFFLFSMEYFGILCSRLFPSDDGMMSKISQKLGKTIPRTSILRGYENYWRSRRIRIFDCFWGDFW